MVEDANIASHFCRMIASDMRLLADLHATELTRERMDELQAMEFPHILALNPEEESLRLILQQLGACIQEWPEPIPDALLDELATDFADIYLNGSLHGAPQESVWIDEEELVCQQPMFEVRNWYAKHHLAVPNWRIMPDDHLVNQLLFIAHILDKAAPTGDLELIAETARFMDEHLLRWLLPFGKRVMGRCRTAFYGSLAVSTALYCEHIRDLMADIVESPRPSREEIEARMQNNRSASPQAMPLRYFPGTAPSW